MSRSDWRRYDQIVIALGIAGIGCLLLFAIWKLSATNAFYTHEADHAASENAKATEASISRNCGDREIVAFTKCVREQVKAEQETQTAQYDLAAQNRMAFWTMWTFFVSAFSLGVTGLGIYFVWRTLKTSDAAVDAANKAIETDKWLGEVQTRAYITFESPEIGFTDDGRPVIRIRARNTGNTTGMLIIVSCSVDFEPMTPKFERRPEVQIFIGSIAPQEEKPKITFVTEASANDRAAATGGNFGFKFTIYGEWVNVFHKEDGAQMSYFVSAKNFESEEREVVIHPDEMQLGKRYQLPSCETE